MIQIEVTGSFRAQADDGRPFVIVEYTEFRLLLAKGTLVKIPGPKFYQTLHGEEVTPAPEAGCYEIADSKLNVRKM